MNENSDMEKEKRISETVFIPQERLDETQLPDHTDEARTLQPGQTVAGGYVVSKQLGAGAQSRVYVAQRGGKKCVVKMYHPGYRAPETLLAELKARRSPYVAELLEYGFDGECFFEVYEYYSGGSLEEAEKYPAGLIRDVVVPNINEGLHFLHTLDSGGVVHGDIKPANLFWDESGQRVVIGDFGISVCMDERGRAVEAMKGTPEYAPPTRALVDQATKTPAYDYGSFGLVLVKLITGHSLFEGLEAREIAAQWEEGLRLPPIADARLGRLVRGLLATEEQVRYGYTEVKRWCEGEYVRAPEQVVFKKEELVHQGKEPFLFGIFSEGSLAVSTLHELSEAIIGHWDHAKKHLRREAFFDFISRFGAELEKEARDICGEQDEDIALFRLLYLLGEEHRLVYKGTVYGNAQDFLKTIGDAPNAEQRRIITGGLFVYYLKYRTEDEQLAEQVRQIIAENAETPELLPRLLYYILGTQKTYVLDGEEIGSPAELAAHVAKMDLPQIEKLMEDEGFLAWLHSMGYGDNLRGGKE